MIEYKRKCSKVVLTELGLYHWNQAPEGYDGASLVVEVVHKIVFVDFDGNITALACNPPKAKNSQGAFAPYPPQEVYTITAEASTVQNGEEDPDYIEGTHYLPQKLIDEAEARIATMEAGGKTKVI